MSSLPPRAPLSVRPDWQASGGALPGSYFGDLTSKVLDHFKLRFAVCNCIHGTQIMMSEDMACAFCRAINDWLAPEWLDRDPRLRASIVVPCDSPELAAEEIERVAADRRFVQVLMLAMGELPLGRRYYWPIYRARRAARAADRHPCRQHLPPSADLDRLAVLLPGGLCRPVAGLRRAAAEPRRPRACSSSSPSSRSC